jgi:excisionase family DNA binding protein
VEDLLKRDLPGDLEIPEVPVRRRTPKASVPIEEATPSSEAVERFSPEAIPGKGGQQHKYLQQLVKRWAEDRGYQVSVEKVILDGLGSVDVAMEKGSTRIACEISISTSPEHEAGNIQKCLAAGFSHVLAIATEAKTLEKVRAAVWSELTTGQRKQVQFLTPEQVFSFVDGLGVKSPVRAVHGAKEILTAKELEELLRIDVKTIYSYAQRGLIPYVRIQSNLRFVRSEVLAWLEKRQFQPDSKRK